MDSTASSDGRYPGLIHGPLENLLLGAMSDAVRGRIAFERVELQCEQTVYEPNTTIAHYVFPRIGILSLVKEMDGDTIEVGTVGHEGMIGIAALLGVGVAATRVFAQSTAVIDRIGVNELDAVLATSPETRGLLLRYVNAFHEEVSQSVACNRLHSLEERCARWLLITHDRTGSNVMPLKQRFLSYMLGVHRPAVSLAASALQRAGIISYKRGVITVLDRPALEEASCSCYQMGRAAFAHARLSPDVHARQ
jgi:cAMP-binding proteins - catabolite gene activator and regulatory subunit of cAMP-dependent protein kinases